MKFEVFFQQDACSDSTNVMFVLTDHHGLRRYAKPIDLVFIEKPEESFIEYTLRLNNVLSRQFFPALIEGLARAGYKYESSSEGELKATKSHLHDMRRLVFKANEVNHE